MCNVNQSGTYIKSSGYDESYFADHFRGWKFPELSRNYLITCYALFNMKLSSYVVTHDYGFAPNPFGGILTLATCKPKIRARASVGDWLMGTGSATSIGTNRLIFVGKISETLIIEDYGRSEKYRFKIPSWGEQKWQRRGDNIYFKNRLGAWEQRSNSFHGKDEMDHDLSGRIVLICEQFWYFGSVAPEIPLEYRSVVKKGPGHKHNVNNAVVPDFLSWVRSFPVGKNGEPSGIKA
jgi:hypothetical protein